MSEFGLLGVVVFQLIALLWMHTTAKRIDAHFAGIESNAKAIQALHKVLRKMVTK